MNSMVGCGEPEATDSRRRFRILLDDAPDACYLCDLGGKFVEYNRAAEILTGYQREELIGKSFLKSGLLPVRELPQALTLLAKNRRGESTGPDEFSLIRKDGRTVQLEITTRPFEHDNRTLIFGIARDISNRCFENNEKSNSSSWSISGKNPSGSEQLPYGAARKSDGVFREFMKHCPLPAFIRDGSGRFIFLNDSAETVFELGHADWRSRTFFDLLPAENAARIKRQDQSVMNRLQPGESVMVLGGDKGDRHWLNRSFPLEGSNGETLVGGWALDITEQQATVKALQDSQERFRALLDQSRELIQSVAPDGRFLFTNRAWRETLGYTEEELADLFIGDLVEPELRSEFDKKLSRAMAGASIPDIETTLLSIDGQPITVRGNLHPYSANDETVATLGFFLDVTEEKQVKEETVRLQGAIEKAANEWVRTVDAVPSAIVVTDLKGRVLRLNRLAAELTGWDFKHNLGRQIGELGAGEPWQTANELVQKARESLQGKTLRTRDGDALTSWEISSNLTRRSDSGEMIIIVARDITETVELQESLRRSELMSSLGSLVASVAHEVRNPLFSISAILDAFEARFQDTIDLQDYTDMLRADIGRLSVLMEDLIDYGRPPTMDFNVGHFERVVSSAVRQTTRLAKSKEVRLVQEDSETDLELFMDEVRLTQLLTNLIENAIQHSPTGGDIAIETGEIHKGDSPWVECKVKDCGPGFVAPVIKKIFEPFFSQRQGGTGLGMSIVHRIAEDHRGEVLVGNRDGGGGVVTVRLPMLGRKSLESLADE